MRPLALAVLLLVSTGAAAEGWKVEGITGWSAVVTGKSERFSEEHGNSYLVGGGLYRRPDNDDNIYYGVEVTAAGSHRNEGRFLDTDVDGDGADDRIDFTSDIETRVFTVMPVLRADNADETSDGDVTYHLSFAAGPLFIDSPAGTQTLMGRSSNGTDQTGRTLSRPARFLVFPGAAFGAGVGYSWKGGLEAGVVLRGQGMIIRSAPSVFLVPALRLSWSF